MDEVVSSAPRGAAHRGADRAALRSIPRTDQLLADPRMAAAERRLGRDLVKAAIGRAQERARDAEITPDQVADAAAAELPPTAASLTPVINATGVLVHTNLGRAPLSAAARDALAAAAGTCDVEFDLATGARAGQRGRGVIEALLPGGARRPGGRRGQQQRRRPRAGGHRPGGRPGDHHQPRRADRDRRPLPPARPARRAPARGCGRSAPPTGPRVEDYQQAVSARHRLHPQGAPLQLPGRGVHQVGDASPSSPRWTSPLVHDIGSGLLAPHPLLPDEPDAATSLAARREPGHRQRRQAARRPAGRPAARRRAPGAPPAAAPARPRAAGRQADPRRP